MSKHLVEGERKDKLRYVKISDITCEGRAREELGDLTELKESVKAKGIIQPITLSTELHLLAGGRRYQACVELDIPTIPAIIRDVEDILDAKEIELIENIHRKDFTWQEQALLTAQIDSLYKNKDPNWSLRKTAEMLDKAPSQTSRQIQLARAIEAIPEIAAAKTADDAFKMLKKLEEDVLITELRRRQDERIILPTHHGVDRGVATALKEANNNYTVSGVFDGMKKLKNDGHIDLIECDPPYGIDLTEVKAGKTVTSTVNDYKEIPSERYEDFLTRLTVELFRVAGKNCWLVFWYGPTWHQQVLEALKSAGWKVDEIPAIWAKPQGQTMQPEMYYARCYEPFFLARKGKPVMTERGHSNVFTHSGAKNKYHPTQRPTALIEEIFKTLAAGSANVFVPFLGSGATLRTCYNMGFKGFGFDLDAKYKDKFMIAVEEDTRKLFSE